MKKDYGSALRLLVALAVFLTGTALVEAPGVQAGTTAVRQTVAAPAATPAPTATPVPVSQLGNTPGSVSTGSVTFSYSRHIYHPGEQVTASITMVSAECRILSCYLGTTWSDAGAPPHHCAPSARSCSWNVPATAPLYVWNPGRLAITTTLGMVNASDYFAVVPHGQAVLDVNVTDPSAHPYPNLALHLAGPLSTTLTTDGNGHAVGLLPGGTYHLRLDAGSALATAAFHPSQLTLAVHDQTSVTITGYATLQAAVSSRTVMADGSSAITVTVHATSPLGTPAASLLTTAQVSGPPAVLCAVPPGQGGLLEPQDVATGSPVVLPVNERADGNGNLSYIVYFGTEPGTWRLQISDANLAQHSAAAARSTVTLPIKVTPAPWSTFFPDLFTVTVYNAAGHPSRAQLTLAQLLWHALHGDTVRFPQKQTNGLTLAALNQGDPVGSQKALLLWLQTVTALHGLVQAPVYSGGAAAWGVALYLHHKFSASAHTRVLDGPTMAALMAASTPAHLPAILSSAAWSKQTNSGVQLGYAQPVAESILTYGTMPYLPANSALNALFEGNCLQRLPAAQ